MSPPRKPSPSTIVALAGVGQDPAHGGIAPPLWASDTSRWSAPDAKPDYDYSRTVNPNRDLLLDTLCALEGAKGGAITGSGQSAALLALLLLPAGAIVVAPHDCYGGTYRLLQGLADKGTLRVTFVDQRNSEAFTRSLEQEPALVWIESPSNPLLRIVDIEKCASEAKAAGALVLADNTLPTPCRQNPLRQGCDLVLHSTTKALNGHHDLFGGALLAACDDVAEQIKWWANAAGLAGSAFDSWQILRGLRTLTLRVDRQERTAQSLASWLDRHPAVAEVHYPGLASHPDLELARRQQNGPGFMLSFRLRGGEPAVRRFVAELRTITLASSLGGFSTLICTPASMTHRGMPPEAREKAGVTDDLLRLSVGLEEEEDLLEDLRRGLYSLGD